MLRFKLNHLEPWRAASALCFLPCALGAGCNLRDDEPKFNELDRLRVLAIRTDPADLLPGDSATLSALAFEPEGGSVSYAWSWCPAPISISEGAGCSIAESDLRSAWQTLNLDQELPSYDLGTGETASFDHVLAPDVVLGLCRALTDGAGSSDSALFTCAQSMQPSIELRVSAGSSEVLARRSLALLDGKSGVALRNQNPSFLGTLLVRAGGKSNVLDNDAPLRAGRKYDLEVGVDPDQAETFLPPKQDGLDDPVPRKETLVMTWYVTQGSTTQTDSSDMPGGPDGPGGASDHTSFTDGARFQDLLQNGWEFPPVVHSKVAELFLVLKDERGGVGWQQFRFGLAEAK